MDIFHGDLKSIKTASFGQLHLAHKIDGQVFIDDAITGGKKGQYMTDKMTFAIVQILPILQISRQVDFFVYPEAGDMIFVLLPNGGIVDGTDNKTEFVF